MIKINGKKRDLKEILRKIEKKIRLKFFENGLRIKKVDEVAITPILKCCLNCAMCHQKQIKHWKDMDFNSFKKVLIELKRAGVTKISLVGGEIFIKKDIWSFIEEMEKRGFKYDLSSNLFFVPNIEKLKQLKWLEIITTSIDGDEKIHDLIRGVPGAFKKSTENIKKILSYGIFVDVACVIQKANFEKLEEILEGVCKLGVKKITLLLENYISEGEKKINKTIIKNLTGKEAEIIVSSLENPLGRLNEWDYKKILEKMKQIKKITKKYETVISLPLQLIDFKVLNKQNSLKNYTCSLFSGYGLTVYNDCDLYQCCFMKLKNSDSLLNKPVFEIVNSKEYLKIRKRFKDYGAFEICRLCCALKKK